MSGIPYCGTCDERHEVCAKPIDLCGRCKREKVNGKCPVCGRPIKYTTDEDMIVKVEQYLATCVDEEYKQVKTEGDKSASYENKLRVKLPTLIGFCLMLGIDDDTLVEWRKEHKEFSASCRKIEMEQQKRLIENGLGMQYQSNMTKFILSANHGMAEKTQQDITTGGKELPAGVIINQAAQALTSKYEEELKSTL